MYLYAKRIFDIFLIVAVMPLWLPIMIILALLVKLTSKGPIFFKQKRFGKNKKIFVIYKFRSMKVDTPANVPTEQLRNVNDCITGVGRIMRRLSLDELPQLINILKGDMSLVGPRPALYNQNDLIIMRENCGANTVAVGLTGLAQIKGRDDLSMQEKVGYDGEYVRKKSFLFDMYILVATVGALLTGRGVK